MVSMENAAKIVYRPDNEGEKEMVQPDRPAEDDFLTFDEIISPERDAAKYLGKRVFDDISELMREKKWEDIIALYHPAEEKIPDLVKAGKDSGVREKIAFAMGQLKRHDDAIKELSVCVKSDPENYFVRSSLAYTAYNSLYAAKNREIFLAGRQKAERIRLAHENFTKALELKPDSVTNYYRQGMLLSQIEGKDKASLQFFEKACVSWENLTDEEKSARHQEKKNYVKSLYRYGSLLLKNGNAEKALERVSACLSLDEKTGYLSLSFKYFALGKVHFYMGNYEKARDALLFANQSSQGKKEDFVAELLAKTYLALGKNEKALQTLAVIPEKFKRPYVRWTEADVLCSMDKFDQAVTILEKSVEKDGRSKHKSLMKLARIHYFRKRFDDSEQLSRKACQFFYERWGNPLSEGLFMQAVSWYRLSELEKAQKKALELKQHSPFYPKLDQLLSRIRKEIS